MPADIAYDAVHERTVGGAKYGCNNGKKRSKAYWTLSRTYSQDGGFVVHSVRVRNNMSKACRNFPLWDTDPKCAGCMKEKDVAYKERMEGME